MIENVLSFYYNKENAKNITKHRNNYIINGKQIYKYKFYKNYDI